MSAFQAQLSQAGMRKQDRKRALGLFPGSTGSCLPSCAQGPLSTDTAQEEACSETAPTSLMLHDILMCGLGLPVLAWERSSLSLEVGRMGQN